jgi:phosphopantothenoylcysteine decarboxylase/phosphopantothenate--cysteine ligase
MNNSLIHKHIIIGVTGGIAAYKIPDFIRRLRDAGAIVRVVMTENAKQFITPLTLQAVSGHPVHDDLFDLQAEAAMGHIELARWADAIVIAPASAGFIARLVNKDANNLLTTLCLATSAPIAIAPAMNQGMWKKVELQMAPLEQQGIHIFGPGEGSQACGDIGLGRMLEPLELVEKTAGLFQTGGLAGKKVMITAGPTHEPIDPVRFMTNGSSGKMGYALAIAAYEAGADVILISGPVKLAKPQGIPVRDVVTAEEMLAAVMQEIEGCDIFIGVAAVSDYRPKTIAMQKIPKQEMAMTLELTRNPDIIAAVASLPNRPIVIGFAAETNDVLEKAKVKMQTKKLDMIIANQVGAGRGMDSDENTVTVISKEGQTTFPLNSKERLARLLIDLIVMAKS